MDIRSAKKEDKTGPDDAVPAEKSKEESKEDEDDDDDEDSEVVYTRTFVELPSHLHVFIWNEKLPLPGG